MAENIREWGRKNGGNSTAKLLKRLLSPSSILVTAFSQLRKKEKGKRENEWDKNESLRCWKDRCTFSVFLYMCVPLLPRVKRRWCTTPPNADQFGGKQSGRQAHFFTFGRPSFSSLFFASLYFYSLSVQSIARQSAAVFFFFFFQFFVRNSAAANEFLTLSLVFLEKNIFFAFEYFWELKNDFPVSTGGGSLNLCTVWWTFFFSPRNFFLQLKLRINEIMSCERDAPF